jgi:hypothetical protein
MSSLCLFSSHIKGLDEDPESKFIRFVNGTELVTTNPDDQVDLYQKICTSLSDLNPKLN